jgi:hypothetical protein
MGALTDAAARILFDKHDFASCNNAGRCIRAGYVVSEGSEGRVRVAHRIPEPDLLDDDRPSDDEMAAERHRMVDEYATTLTAAGWAVEKRGPHSRNPYLLATRPV